MLPARFLRRCVPFDVACLLLRLERIRDLLNAPSSGWLNPLHLCWNNERKKKKEIFVKEPWWTHAAIDWSIFCICSSIFSADCQESRELLFIPLLGGDEWIINFYMCVCVCSLPWIFPVGGRLRRTGRNLGRRTAGPVKAHRWVALGLLLLLLLLHWMRCALAAGRN